MEPRFETQRNVEGRTAPGPEPIHVVFATNAKYIVSLCAAVASLIANFDPERELVIHVIGNGLEAKHREEVRRTAEMNRPGLKHITLEWHPAKVSPQMPVDPNLGVETYLRILVPHILPEEIERAIYLDCDLIVLADLSRLYDATREAKGLVQAAVDISMAFAGDEFGIFDYRERGIPADTRCFNAGVMVMNLKLWRERKVMEPMLEYAARNPDRIFYCDQGALNAFLWRDWTPIDPRWNQGPNVLFPEMWQRAGLIEEWRRTKDDPYIFHYGGPKKPWQPGRRGPRYSYFFRYVDRTVFKDAFPHRPRLEGIIGMRAYYLLWTAARGLAGWSKRVMP
jgi:lipopolysaccharide biosynthesis glycosyltransferase